MEHRSFVLLRCRGRCKKRAAFRCTNGATPVDQLNELEFVEGQIFANVWRSNRIARISPQTGRCRLDRSHGSSEPDFQLEEEPCLTHRLMPNS